MMAEKSPKLQLAAACWTTAGAADPWAADGDDRSPIEITDRIGWASEAGFVGFGIRHRDLSQVEETIGLPRFRQLLDASAIEFLEIEFLEHWYCDGADRVAGDNQVTQFLRFAHDLGPRHIKVGFEVDGRRLEFQRVTERLAELCELFAPTGTVLAIESMPYADVTTPELALEIINAVGSSHLGLVIDYWHVTRAGVTPEDLAQIPAEKVVSVELGDGHETPRLPLITDSIDHRLFPGDGSFPVSEMTRALARSGYQGPWSVEMLSTAFRAMPAREAIAAAATSTREVVEQVLEELSY